MLTGRNGGVFALDQRGNIVSVKDSVIYLENSKINCRKVWNIRCVEGNWEVKVMGENGGWKREFWKAADN